MSSPPETFGDYVHARRTELGYSARQVARLADVAITTVTRIEDGSLALPGVVLLLTMITVLDLDAARAVRLLPPYQQLFDRITEQGTTP
jgi:transcriptional regulator with XRE-family HTH domain